MNDTASQGLTAAASGPTEVNEIAADCPSGLAGVIKQAAGFLGLKESSFFQALLVGVGTVVGNAVKVRTPVFAAPLNLAYHCVFLEDFPDPMTRALDHLLEPLRQFQDERLRALSPRGRQMVEKEIGTIEAAQASNGPSDIDQELAGASGLARLSQLRRVLRPLVLVENPLAVHLGRALRSSFDGALGVLYRRAALSRLLDSASGAGNHDWILLQTGFSGRSYQASWFEGREGQAVVQPAVSCYLIGGAEDLGRLYSSEDPTVSQFAAQTVWLASAEVALENTSSSGLTADPFGALRELFLRLLNLRESEGELVVDLAPEASRILADFYRQEMQQSRTLAPLEQRFSQNTALLAGKIAGSSHLLSAQPAQPISAAVMEKSVQMAARWSAQTAKLADALIQQHREAELAGTAEKMHEFLAEMGKTKPWPLWKRFDSHPKALMQAALDLLVHKGRARRLPDGLVEAVES